MPAHPKTYERLYRDLANATTDQRRDEILDIIIEYQQGATGWDMDQWGFGGVSWPT